MSFYQIKIGNDWTHDRYHLKVKELPIISPPEVKTYTVDVPYSNGSIDLTESLTGAPTFNNRTIIVKFFIHRKDMHLYNEFLNNHHGRKEKIILQEDANYYYEGRCIIGELEFSDYSNYVIVPVSIVIEPFKKSGYKGGVVQGAKTIFEHNEGYNTVAEWKVKSGTASIKINEKQDTITATEFTQSKLLLPHGLYQIEITGEFESLEYRYRELKL